MKESHSEFGILLEPDDDGPHPRVLVCGGAEGGVPHDLACATVQSGFSHGRARDVRHLDFPAAGHLLFPYDPGQMPSTGPAMDLGGSPEEGAKAFAEAWPLVVEHLRGG